LKKEAKTFANCGERCFSSHLKGQKFFGSFFQKRTLIWLHQPFLGQLPRTSGFFLPNGAGISSMRHAIQNRHGRKVEWTPAVEAGNIHPVLRRVGAALVMRVNSAAKLVKFLLLFS
jgi:hypothetical protein